MVPLDDDVMEYFRKRDTSASVYYIGALDATKLRRATKGIGTDESSLTQVICKQRDGLKRLDDQMAPHDILRSGYTFRVQRYSKFLVAIIRDTGYTLAELFGHVLRVGGPMRSYYRSSSALRQTSSCTTHRKRTR